MNGILLIVAIAVSTVDIELPETPGKDSLPEYFLGKLVETYGRVYDYKAHFEYIKTEDSKEKTQICEFSFMKPDYRRLKVLEGDNKGASVAYNPSRSDDRVAAKKGIFPMPGGLALTDSRLEGFFESGWGYEIEEIIGYADDGELEILEKEEIDSATVVPISIIPVDRDSISRAIAWIDETEFLLLRTEFYRYNKFFSRKTWFNIEVNRGLNADYFVP